MAGVIEKCAEVVLYREDTGAVSILVPKPKAKPAEPRLREVTPQQFRRWLNRHYPGALCR